MNFRAISFISILLILLAFGCKKEKTVIVIDGPALFNDTPVVIQRPQLSFADIISGQYIVSGQYDYVRNWNETDQIITGDTVIVTKTNDSTITLNFLSSLPIFSLTPMPRRDGIWIGGSDWQATATFNVIRLNSISLQLSLYSTATPYQQAKYDLTGLKIY